MKARSLVIAGLAITLGVTTAQPENASAQQVQRELPLARVAPTGNFVAPYFDGWIQHDDGSKTFVFAYMNRNASGAVEIPLGPDNFVQPAQFDGMQPTYFPAVDYPGFGGPRERGVFAVRVPAGYTGDVVWTLRNPTGQVTSVPGRATSVAYELSSTPQAAGTLRPWVRFSPEGPAAWGPEGVVSAERLTTSVGVPVALTAWAEERAERAPVALNLTWFKHQGPIGGEVAFEPAVAVAEPEGEGANHGTVMATFNQPGNYMLRVRVDNFRASDSNFGNQCCWSNGYVHVTVSP